ncbi:hypothetical protein [Solibacillus sp. FSL H8-0538]|uniref:hypothetical protein n=1 Tax=Solibacillus sp. FSL H8-0538 TaxID=2921400 RepID=UPI0030F81F25
MRIETFIEVDMSFNDLVADTEHAVVAMAPEGLYDTLDLAAYVKNRSAITNSASFMIE